MTSQPATTSGKFFWFFIYAVVALSAISLGSCSKSESEESSRRTVSQKKIPLVATRTVEGDSFSITLTWLNENRPHVVQLEAYTAFSKDGLFGEGPAGPCPISWAAMWITCTQPVSFEVDILSPTGQLVETLEIEDCAAGSYSYELDPKGVSGGVGAIYTIRFKYQGITFPDRRIRILGYT